MSDQPENKPEPINNAAEIAAARREMIQNAFALRREIMNRLIDPNRDIDKECGYPDTIEQGHYQTFWQRHGVAQRVVSVYPDECWQKDPEVYESDEEDKETEFEKRWKEIAEKHCLYHYLHRMDVMSGIGHYGVMLIGINDGKALNEPIDGVTGTDEYINQALIKNAKKEPNVPKPTGKQREILYLRCFDEFCAPVASYEDDPTNPRFGQPKTYKLKFVDPRNQPLVATEQLQTTDRDVHWTRVVHFADNRTTSETVGTPRMEPVFNYLYDIKKTLSGSAEMFWKGGFPGYSFEIAPEYAAQIDAQGEEYKKEVREEMQKFAQSLQRYMALVGVSAKSLAPQVADPSNHLGSQLDAICITIQCPKRIFMGSEQGELASDQDKGNWAGRVNRRNTRYTTPMVIRPFVQRLVEMGILPVAVFKVDWPDLDAPSDDDIATTADKIANAMAKYMSSGAEQFFPPLEFLIHILKFDKETAEAVIKAAEDNLDKIVDRNETLAPPLDPMYTPPPAPPAAKKTA